MKVTKVTRGLTCAWTLMLAACGGGSDGTQPPADPPTYAIADDLAQGPASLADAGRGPRPIAAMADRHGVVSRFVADEILLRGTAQDLQSFLARHPGTEIASVVPPAWAGSALHVIRLAPFAPEMSNFSRDAAQAGLSGAMRFSSMQGAQLAALTLGEMAAGSARVSLNYVSTGHLLTATAEQADAAGVADAFQWGEFKANHIESVGRAWQFVQAHGIARRVKLAIIDGGFWLNANGVPCDISPDARCSSGLPLTTRGVSDLPAAPVQFDTLGSGSSTAGGTNPNTCTGGASCPWHGNQVASVALGTANNGAGAAGTGGLVADPILLKVDGSDSSLAVALVYAMDFGADIINMSMGHDCNELCHIGHSFGMDDILSQALDAGILIVASAGNDSKDALENHVWPCQYSSNAGNGVYCVGALQPALDGTVANGYYQYDTGQAAPYSNYGLTVNIWASTNIRTMPDGQTQGQLGVFSGTSAAAPFVAGIAAMVKAINPSLGAAEIKGILGNAPFNKGTALVDPALYPDPKVDFVIRAYEAVVAAAGGYALFPDLRITSPAPDSKVVVDQNPCMFKASAIDVQDGPWPPVQGYRPGGPTPIRWTSDVDGPLNVSDDGSASFDCFDAPEGLRHITASVTNSVGKTTSVTMAFTTRYPHATPSPVITWPSNGQAMPPGTYTVTGYARSVDPGALGNLPCSALRWNDSVASTPVPGGDGQCQAQITLAEGLRAIELSATGKFGDTGRTTIFVNVAAEPGLFVQIIQPADGSYRTAVNGNGTIGLAANTGPAAPGSSITVVWSWYPTGSDPTSKHVIAVGGGSETWSLAGPADPCATDSASTRDITIEAYAEDRSSSPPFDLLSSGTSRVGIHLDCQILR